MIALTEASWFLVFLEKSRYSEKHVKVELVILFQKKDTDVIKQSLMRKRKRNDEREKKKKQSDQ